MHKIDGPGVKFILYFINRRMLIVVLDLYLRKKSLLTGQKAGDVVVCHRVVCILMLILLPQEELPSHILWTQVTSSQPSPRFHL